jgi:hypothetical protein
MKDFTFSIGVDTMTGETEGDTIKEHLFVLTKIHFYYQDRSNGMISFELQADLFPEDAERFTEESVSLLLANGKLLETEMLLKVQQFIRNNNKYVDYNSLTSTFKYL